MEKVQIPRAVFIAGGTGYIGSRLIPRLLERGYQVWALARSGSEAKLPLGCLTISGNALDGASYREAVRPCHTFVQLVGVSHPSPAKAAEFRRVDLVACQQAVAAAIAGQIEHFVYVSVAQPAPVMKAYVEVRAQCEELIRTSGLNATILRPWYVLGPGHRWPYLLIPAYWLLEKLPKTRESARRLGLITMEQMIQTLLGAIEHPALGVRVIDVPQMGKGPVENAVSQAHRSV